MKLNPECVRSLMLWLEKQEMLETNARGDLQWVVISLDKVYDAFPKYSHEEIYYTLSNLGQAGLLITTETPAAGGVIIDLDVQRITFQGHEFIEKIRDDKRWSAMGKVLSHVRDYSLAAIKSVAEGVSAALLDSYAATAGKDILDGLIH